MGWFTRVLITSCISIGMALGLAYIFQLDSRDGGLRDNISVFKSNEVRQLTDDGLVDDLLSLPLTMTIKKVDWSHSILTIDLKADSVHHPSAVFADLYELADYSFVGTSNVKQVLIRIVDSEGSQAQNSRLLLAMNARREDVQWGELSKAKRNQVAIEPFLNEHFHLTYTDKWLQWLQMKL